MEKDKLVSIVVPIYNVEKYIKKCVSSIIKQTYKNIEIILVNDGSTDSCYEICNEYLKVDKRIKVIHKKNGGLSDARNVGIINSKGKYITFIDSDDYVDNNYIDLLYTSIIKNDADISIVSHRVFYDTKQIDKSTGEEFCANSKEILEKILYDDGIDLSSWGKLYKIELFKNIKFPVGRLYEDSATTYKLVDLSKKISVCSKPVYNYVIRNNSISNSPFDEKKLDLIISTKEMTDFIKEKYPELEKAANRKMMHAYLSTLSQLSMSNKKFPNEKNKIINYIKKNRASILKDKKVPKRDKIALITTVFGFKTYKFMWNMYRKITGRE